MRPTTAPRLAVAGTCAVIFGVGMLTTGGATDEIPEVDRAPISWVPSTGHGGDGWQGPLPRRGPVQLLSQTELPAVAGLPAAVPVDEADPFLLAAHDFSGDDYVALRADRPVYSEAQMTAPQRRVAGLSSDARVADLRVLSDGLVQAVLGPADGARSGRIVQLWTSGDGEPSIVGDLRMTGPLDALGIPDVLLADSAGSRTYVLRALGGGRTVELTALRGAEVLEQTLVDLPATRDAQPWALVASPDGRSAVLVYGDDGDTVVAAVDVDLTVRYTTRFPGGDPSTTYATIDDSGAVQVLRPEPDADGTARASITRLSPGGVPGIDPVRIRDYLYVDGAALGPLDERTGEGRWLYVSGLSEETGVLGVVVVDLRDGAVVADFGLCTDYADGFFTRPEVSSDRSLLTVVGDCFVLPTIYQLRFDARA
ncbi:hypothetical protein [Blastococcus litoris]|uniref:hypothetical protein n=1 Tax=Blastococcus litoris TaxID=2171622 RepID=UPI000E308A3B|nr:hypothetical protein [Blastococcus litoris]